MNIATPSRTTFTRLEVADACRKWGSSLHLEGLGIDGATLLWAISGRESSFGYNCKPRFEPAYAKNTTPAMVSLRERFGDASACSFGPWQIMMINAADVLHSVEDFASLNFCAVKTVNHISRAILEAQGAQTIDQIADAYNSGNFRDKIVPTQYIADVKRYYASVAMPHLS